MPTPSSTASRAGRRPVDAGQHGDDVAAGEERHEPDLGLREAGVHLVELRRPDAEVAREPRQRLVAVGPADEVAHDERGGDAHGADPEERQRRDARRRRTPRGSGCRELTRDQALRVPCRPSGPTRRWRCSCTRRGRRTRRASAAPTGGGLCGRDGRLGRAGRRRRSSGGPSVTQRRYRLVSARSSWPPLVVTHASMVVVRGLQLICGRRRRRAGRRRTRRAARSIMCVLRAGPLGRRSGQHVDEVTARRDVTRPRRQPGSSSRTMP